MVPGMLRSSTKFFLGASPFGSGEIRGFFVPKCASLERREYTGRTSAINTIEAYLFLAILVSVK